MAPELLRDCTKVTEACDIYSFGVVMWEVWTMEEPFDNVLQPSLLYQLTHQGLTLPIPGEDSWKKHASPSSNTNQLEEDCRQKGGEAADLGPVEPVAGFKELMLKCLSNDPGARPTSSQLVEDLEAMCEVVPQPKPRRKAAAP
jgi:serine/threonine protein kinase